MKNFKTQFVTFYSYKGGVGRTSALINTALLMSIKGERIVILDFDLEAPGLSSYIMAIAEKNNIDTKIVEGKRGVLEYLHDAINTDVVPELKKYSISNDQLGLNTIGKIWFIGAGDTFKMDYSRKLNSLDWTDIFEKKHGQALLENFKNQIIEEFENPDYVFIDSRTGITDIGGVCTNYLSDLVVILSALNNQNIQGTSKVISSFKKSNIDTILVASNIPVGLPLGENQLLTDRINKFSESFGKDPDLFIYHYPSLSVTEYLPSLFKLEKYKSVLHEDPLLISYENLSTSIKNKNQFNFENAIKDVAFRIIFEVDTKESELVNDLKNLRKYYSNRVQIIDLLSMMQEVNAALTEKSSKNLIKPSIIKSLNVIKNYDEEFKNEYGLTDFYAIREIMLLRASNEIARHIKENFKDIKFTPDLFNVLSDPDKIKIVIDMVEHEKYKFLVENLKDSKSIFLIFSRAYAAEKNREVHLANKTYEIFTSKLDFNKTEIKHPSRAFMCSYAFYKLGNKDKALEYAKLTKELIANHSEKNFFVPTKFVYVDDKGKFLSELKSFENEL